MTTITKEWLQQTIAEFENTRDDIPFGLSDDDAKILIVLKRALASLEVEPAGYHVIKECGKVGCSVATLEEAEKTRDFWNKKWTIRPYFYSAQPASEREQIRREHAEWSDKTFGDVGPVGPLKHLSKEALEAAADPSDPLEWADMQFLLWDAQRRMGLSDEFITRAMIEKLEINKSRQWPEPKDGEPLLHIKEQPAPVVPDGYCIMPVALTAKNGAKWALSGEFSTAREVTCPECEGDGCSDCDGRGDWCEDQTIDWTTIKEIYRRAVEACALPTGQTQDKIA